MRMAATVHKHAVPGRKASLYEGHLWYPILGITLAFPVSPVGVALVQGLRDHDWRRFCLGTGPSGPWKLRIQEGGGRRCGIPPEQPRQRNQCKDMEKPTCKTFCPG
jgi:hypothetical protein